MNARSILRVIAIFTAFMVFLIVPFQPSLAVTNDNPQRIIEDRKPVDDNFTKIVLLYDMEGLSGQNILTSIDFPRPEYFEARKLLTDDVNAVIQGLFDGGADSVTVIDAHGSFNPEPDILLDQMDPRAKMMYREKRFDSYVDLLDDNSFDAMVLVGMHSKVGGGGFAEHTVNLGTDWILNGMSLCEAELFAYSWGRIGVPVIFISGDDKLAEQVSWMTWAEYVTVKEAKGIDDALLYPVDLVHQKLTAAAGRAVENLDRMKAVTLTEPITSSLRVVPPADLSILENVPGIDYNDQSVTFKAADFKEAYDGMRAFIGVAQSGYINIGAEMCISQDSDSFMNFKEAIFKSWVDAVNKKDQPETADNQAAKQETGGQKKLYFGSK